MKINPNLLPRQGNDGKFVPYMYATVGEILKNYIGQKITISCDVESTHDDTEVSVYPYQVSGISINNETKYYTVGKTKKRIVDVRTVTKLYENLNVGQIMFYNNDTAKKIKVTNIKIELGTEATLWIPHRDDLTETQRNLMPEHLFGGGYRVDGDSSDIATEAGWGYASVAEFVRKFHRFKDRFCWHWYSKNSEWGTRRNRVTKLYRLYDSAGGVYWECRKNVLRRLDRFSQWTIADICRQWHCLYGHHFRRRYALCDCKGFNWSFFNPHKTRNRNGRFYGARIFCGRVEPIARTHHAQRIKISTRTKAVDEVRGVFRNSLNLALKGVVA